MKMRILIGIIGNDAARFHLFTASVMKLDTNGLDVDQEMLIGGDWCGARNSLVEMTLEGDYTHLWFMDDDHAFAPDLLKRLASHNVPLINPLCLTRVAPFPLVTYASKGEGEKQYLPIDMNGLPGQGLVELEAAGCAGMLIRRDVLEAVSALPGQPFEYGDRSEDIVFCEKAKACGFKLYADLGARLGHITTTVVYPDISEGKWMTRLKIGGGLDLFVSPAQDWEVEEPGEGEIDPVESPLQVPAAQPPVGGSVGVEPTPEEQHIEIAAGRIEIWMDEDLRWWWRAVPEAGDEILGHGSSVSEQQTIADATAAFPGLGVHVIQREVDDSRSPENYGPPTRLWNRGS